MARDGVHTLAALCQCSKNAHGPSRLARTYSKRGVHAASLKGSPGLASPVAQLLHQRCLLSKELHLSGGGEGGGGCE